MFIGSFYRLKTKKELDTSMIIGSPTAIIYVEDEGKMYEKNSFGAISNYDCVVKNSANATVSPDNSEELKKLTERVNTIEMVMDNFSKIFKGGE